MRLITILCERVLLNRVNTIHFISTHLCISSTNPFETTLPPCSSLLSVNVALCWSYARTPYHFHQCAPLILNFLTKPSCHMTCRMQVPSHSYSLCKLLGRCVGCVVRFCSVLIKQLSLLFLQSFSASSFFC